MTLPPVRLRRIKRLFAWLAAIMLTIYLVHMEDRRDAEYMGSSTAPNGEYRIDRYAISGGNPMVLMFKVFDREHELVGEYVRRLEPGSFREDWACDKDRCSEYSWTTDGGDPIILPPSWLDRLRAMIP
jgi:hypothetical protein